MPNKRHTMVRRRRALSARVFSGIAFVCSVSAVIVLALWAVRVLPALLGIWFLGGLGGIYLTALICRVSHELDQRVASVVADRPHSEPETLDAGNALTDTENRPVREQATPERAAISDRAPKGDALRARPRHDANGQALNTVTAQLDPHG